MRNHSKTPLDFLQIIERGLVAETSEGRFFADAQADSKFPNARSWKELKYYFDTFPTQVADEYYIAAKRVWRKYRAKYPAYLEHDHHSRKLF